MIELMIGVAILAIVGAAGMVSFNALSSKKDVQYEAEMVRQDIYVMQSRAVTGLRDQRFVILSNSSYQLEEDSLGTGTWTVFQTVRTLKPGVLFSGYVGKETKLEYKPSGLPDFNGASASPFFSIVSTDGIESKSLNIDVSGVVNIESD